MNSGGSLGELFVWDRDTEAPKAVESYRGKKLRQLASSNDQLVALDGEGKLTWLKGEPKNVASIKRTLDPLKLTHISMGPKHSVVVDSDGALYTWGVGNEGQLGLGHADGCTEPEMVLSSLGELHSQQSSCGNAHTCVITEEGDLFSFGRGHEGQIGHGDRPSQCVILAPQYIHKLYGAKMKAVACGRDFTIALSTTGKVFSWGAGDLGQLGTGRVTKRVIPQMVEVPTKDNDPLLGVAAGWGHVLVSSKKGALFSWGFNAYGQLGLGHKKAIFKPERVVLPSGESFPVAMPSANKHYSAALTKSGALYSWGSIKGCLGLDKSVTQNIDTPQQVMTVKHQSLRHIATADTCMAAFAKTSIRGLWPTSGPETGGTTLELDGSGFFKLDGVDIRICFMAPDMPAQVVIGTFDPVRNKIICETPAWVEEEEEEEEEGVVYEDESEDDDDYDEPPKIVIVEVSVNGVEWTTDRHIFEYYQQAKVTNATPGLLPVTGGQEVVIEGDLFIESPDIKVRFMDVVNSGDDGDARAVIVDGAVRYRSIEGEGKDEGDGKEEESKEDNKPRIDSGEELLDEEELLGPADIVCIAPEFPGAMPVTCKVSVALNGTDFTDDHILIKYFDPTIVQSCPNSGLATGTTNVELKGRGYIPGETPTVRFRCGNITREVTGECVSETSVILPAPAMLMGLSEEELEGVLGEVEELAESKDPTKAINSLWASRAAKQPSAHSDGSVCLTFDGTTYGEPVPFHYYQGEVLDMKPNIGTVDGGSIMKFTGNGEWFFDSDSIDIKFENPKFSTSVKGTYDPESNAVTCEAPPLITEETMAPLAKLEEDLTAALEELGEDGDEKKIKKLHDKFAKDKKKFMKSLPKYKVSASLSLNGSDYHTGKALAFTYHDPLGVPVVEPAESGSIGDTITLTAENIISSKTIIVRFTDGEGIDVVANGKYNKSSSEVAVVIPAMELPPPSGDGEPTPLPCEIYLSINGGVDWCEPIPYGILPEKPAEDDAAATTKGKGKKGKKK